MKPTTARPYPLAVPRLLFGALLAGLAAPAVRWLERGGGWWPEQIHLSGDFDGDGRADIGRQLADGNNRGDFDLLRNVGDGFVAGPWAIDGLVIGGDQYAGVGDVDGDGRSDAIRVWEHDGRDDGGVLSGSISLAAGGGFELRYSVNLAQVYGYGRMAFGYAQYGVEASIGVIGDGIDYIADGLDDAAGTVEDVVDDVVGVIGGLF